MIQAGNVLFCGVGGQGILLASEVTAFALLAAGFDVKKSEVHGMAQRGGSVVAHLRYGEQRVYSPLIEPGEGDVEVAFEMLESIRYLPFLSPRSRVIVNTQQIAPPVVATGKAAYPPAILEEFAVRGITALPVDAFAIAQSLGEPRTVNIVLVGALSRLLPVEEATFLEVLRQRVPARFLEVNLRAFHKGREVAEAVAA